MHECVQLNRERCGFTGAACLLPSKAEAGHTIAPASPVSSNFLQVCSCFSFLAGRKQPRVRSANPLAGVYAVMEAAKFNLRSPAVKRILQASCCRSSCWCEKTVKLTQAHLASAPQEIKEIRREASEDFLAEALEENIFEWHFVIRGSPDTEFRVSHPAPKLAFAYVPGSTARDRTNQSPCLSVLSRMPYLKASHLKCCLTLALLQGGVYHGRILLPADYPFKPPSFTMLTPNGRFEINTKICLSISSHHPEHWQPSWSVRTALVALTAFMPSPGHGAIGSLVG